MAEGGAIRFPLLAKMAMVCVPLTLAPPMITVAGYGITLTEMIGVMTGVIALLVGARVPAFVLSYLFLYTAGWLGSLFNGFSFGIAAGPRNAVFLYSLLLALVGYCIGRSSAYGLTEILRQRVARWLIVGVGLFAAAYPFLGEGVRYLIMSPFINDQFLSRLGAPRFPGIGINGNVYSFMVFTLYLFSLDAFLENEDSWVMPLSTFVIIVAAASRTVMVLALGSCLVLMATKGLRRRIPEWQDRLSMKFSSKRRVAALAALFALMTVGLATYASQVQKILVVYDRFDALFAQGEESGLSVRVHAWSIGAARIRLAPVLGIPRDPSRNSDDNPVFHYTPHNEFLALWTMFGFLGMLAHVFLIAWMVSLNLRKRAPLPWLLFYGGMFVQMMVDSVFASPRTMLFLFMIVGLNIRFLAGRPCLREKPVMIADDDAPRALRSARS